MGIIKRQTIKSSVVIYLGIAIGAFNMLYLFPAFLQAHEIGLYRVLLSASLLFSSISQLGATSLMVRFFNFFETEEERTKFLGLNILIITLGFTFYVLIFNLFKEEIIRYYQKNSPLILEYYSLTYYITFFFLVTTLCASYSRTLKRIVVPNLFSEVFLRLGIVLMVVAYSLSLFSFDTFLEMVVVIYGLVSFAILVYVNSLRKIKLSFAVNKINISMLKNMLQFSLLSTITGVAGTLVGTIDTLMISGMKNLDQTGIYSIAFFMGVIIEVPRRSISQIAAPIVAVAWKENRLEEIKTIYQKSSVNQFIFGSFILICLWLNIDDVFNLIPKGDLYSSGKYVVLFIGLGKLFDMVTGVNSEIIANSKYYYTNLFFLVFLAALTVATNAYFIPIYGIKGAALASLISIVAFNLLKMMFLYFAFNLQPLTFQTIKVGFICAVTVLCIAFLPDFGFPLLNIVSKTTVALLVFFPLVIKFKVSEDVNATVKELLVRIKNKNTE